MNFQTMNKQRKFVLIAAAIGIISMFLPWISFFGFTINGMHGSGILVFLCFIVSGIIALLGDQTRNLDKTMWGITLIAGAIALLVILYFLIDSSGNSNLFGSATGFSFGFYLSGLAAIGVLASAYLFRSPTDSLKDSFSGMKKNLEDKISNTGSTTPPVPPPPTPGSTYEDPGDRNTPL
jgi:peptidoglycan/LPS O-acetylase OafA/YrhL